MYQREWRFLQSLSKIRDAITPTVLDLDQPLRGLRRLISRGERILAERTVGHHENIDHAADRDRLAEAVRIASHITGFIGKLTELIHELEAINSH